jgi:hypothetical protein
MLHGAGIFLLGAIGGYWLLERAESHKRGLRRIGRLLGAFIIIFSLLGLVCSAACGRGGGWMKKGGMCPLFPKASTPTATPYP